MQGEAETFNILFLKHEMPGQQEANNFLEINAKGIRQYRNLTFYTFCCSFTQNVQSFTSTVETITQIYIH